MWQSDLHRRQARVRRLPRYFRLHAVLPFPGPGDPGERGRMENSGVQVKVTRWGDGKSGPAALTFLCVAQPAVPCWPCCARCTCCAGRGGRSWQPAPPQPCAQTTCNPTQNRVSEYSRNTSEPASRRTCRAAPGAAPRRAAAARRLAASLHAPATRHGAPWAPPLPALRPGPPNSSSSSSSNRGSRRGRCSGCSCCCGASRNG